MVTILLADDERIFKVVQGTLLRRDACRLLKASFASLPSLAVEQCPDLVIVPALTRDRAVHRLVKEMRGRPDTRDIPIIILDIDRGDAALSPLSLDEPEGAPVESVGAGKNADPDRLETELAVVFEKLLDLEGRATKRVPTEVPVECTLGSSRFTARTKDISRSGLFLKTEHGVHSGDRLAVSFRLPSGAVDGECEVVRLIAKDRDDPDLIPGAGLRFVSLSRHGQELLERFAPPASDRPARSATGHVTH